MTDTRQIISHLHSFGRATRSEYGLLLTSTDTAAVDLLMTTARRTAVERFGNEIYIRGLVEVTNCCRNDCYYCGIRRSNRSLERYRLTVEQIVECCRRGHAMGFRTFVIQGGEGVVSADEVAEAVSLIVGEFPDSAVTLSLGEYDEPILRRWFEAGATRYLLRHETADRAHYERLHPSEMSFDHRRECLATLKRIGYQTGAGMMIGSPYQTTESLIDDLEFLAELQPEMVGIGPFVPQSATPFAGFAAGSVELTLRVLAIVRLLLPDSNLPATTALATLSERGRERAILAGANVVMPNLSPQTVRNKYTIYDNKKSFDLESAEGLAELEKQLNSIGYHISDKRGDYQKRS
ncbi:MAG: [FeFe] hydrogenase H-cluster radical SAM maturase HydE [Tidjanibacter sp.]|nr:[FeFe] hydrogenase H-cluster radical SAM maturase HydE [Tidjanibacter sp.]